MPRLIIVSNRVNLPTLHDNSMGGLAVALQDALNDIGGVWLGWNGEVSPDQPISTPHLHTAHHSLNFQTSRQGNVDYVTTPFSPQQHQHYYCGFANSTLWPAMHNRLDLVANQADDYAIYQQINQQFAIQLKALAQPDDVIWVHDYHFLAVAHYCRKLNMPNRIGFFLHTPFAAPAVWQQLPHWHHLIAQLTSYNLIGVQTPTDQLHCQQLLLPLIQKPNSQLHIGCYPVGINPDHIQQLIQVQNKDSLRYRLHNTKTPKTIIAVDRIDYSKGLIERFLAYQAFLQQYPNYQKKLKLLQIAGASRMHIAAYQAIYQQVTQNVKLINESLGDQDWQPIDYRQQLIAHDQLMQLYHNSAICWVNSLKDGMNLVAKEYIAAQNPDNPGVLMLSKYAGAAEQMTAALHVDPMQPDILVAHLHTALTMKLVERKARYNELIQGLKSYNIERWQQDFLNDLTQAPELPDLNQSHAKLEKTLI